MARLGALGILVSLMFWPMAAECFHPVDDSCIPNMKQIDGAVQQWALEHKIPGNAAYSLSNPELLGYLKGSVLPVCPLGGRYLAGRTLSADVYCTAHGTIEQANEAMFGTGRIRARQLYLCAILSVVLMTLLTSPLPWFSADFRRLFTVAMLPAILVLADVFASYGNPPGRIRNVGETPAIILVGFGVFLAFRLSVQEKRWRRAYGAFFATLYVAIIVLKWRSHLR
jgi:hypothetical protein